MGRRGAGARREIDLVATWRAEPAGTNRPATARSGVSPWIWAAAAGGSASAMAVAFAAQIGAPWQPVAALVFLAVGPGASLVPLIGLRDREVELMLVVPVSFAVVALTSAALFYRGFWSPGRELVLLLAVCLLGLAGQRLAARRRVGSEEPR